MLEHRKQFRKMLHNIGELSDEELNLQLKKIDKLGNIYANEKADAKERKRMRGW